MLNNKVNELFKNNVFKNIKESVISNNLFNYVFFGVFLKVFYIFDFSSLTTFSLFLLTLKFLLNLDNYNTIEKIKYMTNLLKFWAFYGVVIMTFDIYYYICELTLFYKGLQLFLIYYLYEQSVDWFSSINYMIENSNELNTELSGSIDTIDYVLNTIIKVYRINKLSLDFSLKIIGFLLYKFVIVITMVKNSFRYIQKKSNSKSIVNEVREVSKEKEVIVDNVEKEVIVDNVEKEVIIDNVEKEVIIDNVEKEVNNKLIDTQIDLLLDSVSQHFTEARIDTNIDQINALKKLSETVNGINDIDDNNDNENYNYNYNYNYNNNENDNNNDNENENDNEKIIDKKIDLLLDSLIHHFNEPVLNTNNEQINALKKLSEIVNEINEDDDIIKVNNNIDQIDDEYSIFYKKSITN